MHRLTRFAVPALLGAACCAAATHWFGTPAQADSATFSAVAPTAKFAVRSLAMGTTYQTERIDTTTGDSWYAANGKWVKVGDDTPPGPGIYDVEIIYMPDNKTYSLIRFDAATGRAWYNNGPKWSLFTEP